MSSRMAETIIYIHIRHFPIHHYCVHFILSPYGVCGTRRGDFHSNSQKKIVFKIYDEHMSNVEFC